ncbi:hypothetical protein HDV63DRAFT_272276 [Trichoderma sp. SZMC 28014]
MPGNIGDTTPDIEMQQAIPPGGMRNGWQNQIHGSVSPGSQDSYLLQSLFPLSKIPHDQLRQVSHAFCRYLEARFAALQEKECAVVWDTFHMSRPECPQDCWQLFRAICEEMSSLSLVSTTNDISKILAKPPGRVTQTPDACSIAVFAILCWSTMMLDPVVIWDKFEAYPKPGLVIQRHSLGHEWLRMEYVKQPIQTMFRKFSRFTPTRWRHPLGAPAPSVMPVSLEVSCLNYQTLSVIGKIHLVWVSDLNSHLDFDANKRQLCIFRFPSFCALSILAGKAAPESGTLVKELTRQLCGAGEGADGADLDVKAEEPFRAEQLHQEVMMSYRLLFGQKRGSRRLAGRVLKRQKDGKKKALEHDTLLDVVCTQAYNRGGPVSRLPPALWPVTCLSFDGILQENTSYSSIDDFPIFGNRLAKLQEFTLRQHPSELTDLWRDRRNPLQWYTFWAVLIVGGVSIFLSIVQAGVSIAQLAISIKSS